MMSDTEELDCVVLECNYEPPHEHYFPSDWQFGGPNETDPRADPRWIPTTYTYLDERLESIHVTQVPICDDQAIDNFTQVAGWGKDFNPVWIQAERPNGVVEILKVKYDKETDMAEDIA